MAQFGKREVTYRSLNNEFLPPLGSLVENTSEHAPTMVAVEDEDINVNIIHRVPKTKGAWTHIDDLDSFFVRMYKYYVRGGFYPMVLADFFYLVQFIFIVWFSTFLIYCVDYPRLFRNNTNTNRSGKLSLSDVLYSSSVCVERVSWQWWVIVTVCLLFWGYKLVRILYHSFLAYDAKSFYNNALKIKDSDLAWVNWSTVQERVRQAQSEHHMCVHKREISDLDIYHRILRFNNYLVAMVNKNLLPLHIPVPFCGSFHYLSRGLTTNLEFLLFTNPWSPWENCWQLRPDYKDSSKRMFLARKLERQILLLAIGNLILAPLVQAWQILYFFFNYAEIIKRSPGSLGMRTWSLYARVTLRHFNELEHELRDRLNRAHKPATKYLASFPSPITTVVAKNVVFLTASVLGVLVALSVYDEDVLTVEHVLTIITILGCVIAIFRALIGEEDRIGCAGPSRGEELFVQVLGHVHYLPAAWRGRAHTKDVAEHFQQLFQFRAVYILFELLSPVLCPIVLFQMKYRALDIVDFYRNFTVSVLGIGDVCSFAQLDIRRHGNPDWHTSKFNKKQEKEKAKAGKNIPLTQYGQGEGGKTELSLVAFSCRHPAWQPTEPSQRQFLKSLRHSMHQAVPTNALNRTMLGSFIQQSVFGAHMPIPAVLSYYQHQREPFRLPEMDEPSDDEEHPAGSSTGRVDERSGSVGLAGVASALGAGALGPEAEPETDDMSVSTLHLYDVHLSQEGATVSNPDAVILSSTASNVIQSSDTVQKIYKTVEEQRRIIKSPRKNAKTRH